MFANARRRRTPSSSMARNRRRIPPSSLETAVTIIAAVAVAMALLPSSSAVVSVEAFATPSTLLVGPRGSPPPLRRNNHRKRHSGNGLHHASPTRPTSSSSTSLAFGGDSGILGVGTPEVAVIVVVGYFILGPSELYKLVKEIGKFVQNLRTLGTEAAAQFEGSMEEQLEITELRKAQAELTDAFSFRRSINTDQAESFASTSFEDNRATQAAAVAVAEGGAEVAEGATPTKKKRRLVRRKKKKVVQEVDVPSEEAATDYPDLDMMDAELTNAELEEKRFKEEQKRNELRAARRDRLGSGGETAAADGGAAPAQPDWFTASEEDIASEVLEQNKVDPAVAAFEKDRFQAQLSAEAWNSQVMANEDELAPLSLIMKRIAILEEEKQAADRLLEEEYQKKMNNEDKYYLEKRRVLEEAITEIQEGVYSKNEEDEIEHSQMNGKAAGGGSETEKGELQEEAHSEKDVNTDTRLLEKENDNNDEKETEVDTKKEQVEESGATTFSA